MAPPMWLMTAVIPLDDGADAVDDRRHDAR
jgi:hypothetical protein